MVRLSLYNSGMKPRHRTGLTMLLITVAYAVSLWTCLKWLDDTSMVFPVLVTSGIAFAAMIRYGVIMVPAVFLGAVVGFLLPNGVGLPLHVIVGLAAINSVVPWASSRILKTLDFNPDVQGTRDLLLIIAVGVVGSVISGLFGASMFIIGGLETTTTATLHHILGEIAGIIVVGTFLLAWTAPRITYSRLEIAGMLGGLCLITVVSVILNNVPGSNPWLKPWHLFPFMIWMAVAYNLRGVSAAMAVVGMSTSFAVVQSTGPWGIANLSTDAVMFSVQQYISFTALTMLFLAVVADERKNKAALEAAAERYKAIVNTAVDAIIVINSRSIIQSFNQAAVDMFGWSEEEAIGKPLSIIQNPEDTTSHHGVIERYQKTGVGKILGTRGVEVRARRADGESFPVHIAIAEWRVGDEVNYTGIIRDLSQDRRREQSRDLLIREIDHRAKNALAVVQSLVQLSRGETKEDYIDVVRGRISALSRAHSLLSQNKWEGTDIHKVLQEELSTRSSNVFIRGQGISLETDTVQPFSMIIHELQTNAIKYGCLSKPEGRVDIEWKVTPEKDLMVVWRESGGPECLEPERRGFGSKLLHQLAHHQLNGSLVKKWDPTGLEAVIRLPPNTFQPARREDKIREEVVELPDPSEVQGQRILVVEDNALLAMEMSHNLEDMGYEVIGPASTLEQGVDLARQAQIINGAVLDINLAGRMSFPIAEILKDKNIPYVFCTGYETPDFPLSLQGSEVIQKPINEVELSRRLRSIVRETE